MIPFLNLSKQYDTIRDEILEVTDLVYRSGVLMNGPYTKALEEQMAKRMNMGYCIAVGSGTQALEMIAEYHRTHQHLSKDVVENQLVVCVPALTYPATINAWIRAGWTPTIVDTDSYGVMDMAKMPDYQEYSAVCTVGLYGHPVNDGHNLRWKILVEDAAQHWLATLKYGKRPITLAVSLDPTKNLGNYGNGGAIVTHDIDAAHWFRACRDNGKPDYTVAGTNSRISEADAAQLLVKLKYVDQWQDQRRSIAGFWSEWLEHEELIRPLINKDNINGHALQKYVVEIDHRDRVQQLLHSDGIQTKIHYDRPLHEIPLYQDYRNPGHMSVSSMLSRRVLSLPFYPEMTDTEVSHVIDCLIKRVKDCSKSRAIPSHN
ncbi:MAG: DegT/DnrJ/EryC1/StrS aminotransferase family protein [Euryarchaeota archaeon]|nr:DegT/DnrJ/EryC1/StrS aminotransferase family protein [Euryarchaeota archaeon]